jgi:hypothetical protein
MHRHPMYHTRRPHPATPFQPPTSLAPLTPEYLGNKSAPLLEHKGDDGDGSQHELPLNILVKVMQPRHIRRAITDDEVCLVAVEV